MVDLYLSLPQFYQCMINTPRHPSTSWECVLGVFWGPNTKPQVFGWRYCKIQAIRCFSQHPTVTDHQMLSAVIVAANHVVTRGYLRSADFRPKGWSLGMLHQKQSFLICSMGLEYLLIWNHESKPNVGKYIIDRLFGVVSSGFFWCTRKIAT